MDLISASQLSYHWNREEKLGFDGQHYRVGRMSYGAWFLESGMPQGETKPFNRGTLWLERDEQASKDAGENMYQVDPDSAEYN